MPSYKGSEKRINKVVIAVVENRTALCICGFKTRK
jgi:hypothetical protein